MLWHARSFNKFMSVGIIQQIISRNTSNFAEVLLIRRSDKNELPAAGHEFFVLVYMPGIYDAAALRQFHKAADKVARFSRSHKLVGIQRRYVFVVRALYGRMLFDI